MPNPLQTDWTAFVRTKTGRLISTDVTTISNSIADATAEVSSRFASNDVTLYPKGYRVTDVVKNSVASTVSVSGDVAAGGYLLIGIVAFIFWPITLTILAILVIKFLWGRPYHTAIPALIVSELPWCIKRPLRRRFKWLND